VSIRRELESGLRAPLTQPGVNVVAGEYILAVNGVDLRHPTTCMGLEGTANKQVVLRVGSDPGWREFARGYGAAIRANLRFVIWHGWKATAEGLELSGGQLAYVYLPDTAQGGYVISTVIILRKLGSRARD